ncbi:glycerate kinase [Lactococcus sp. LG1267]|uniref:glycerate kinase family protein n=1 Tax=Lactococcus sp. LG1267 TaxID=2816910 RepID=UPI001A8C7531|nr:glycerate kinase [Lactococcus sp. LG1267]QSR03221.1 glycerate kinase [Lactococcus sp. LG1267]
MKVVVAIDSFKGSATSAELNQAVKTAILSTFPKIKVARFEIADGGEGSVSALQSGLEGKLINVKTVNLMQRPMQASYLLMDERLAVIEAAKVVGIDKIKPNEKTIQEATTFGLGALFLDAKKRGATEIILSLGGSGTSDGGLGLLEALEAEDFSAIKITGLADVTNVYAGAEGYAKVFGKQKGGTAEILEQQDRSAQAFVQKIKKERKIDLQKIPGTGAAGGLGGALILLGGTLEPGFNKIAELLKIEEAIKTADLIITGEGQMDFQTAKGKVPFGMAKLGAKYHVPTIAFCGSLSEDLGEMNQVLLASYSIQRKVLPLAKAMENEVTLKNIEVLTKNVLKTWCSGQNDCQ